jgi:dolichyl-diphosphooligosaccharide--protein glycosyltransferase/undecaprenyl-diphosphooligosaccharide--protein glycosyltransferase
MIWVYQFGGVDSFMWNSELMINTNDGYYFAEGARDILANDYTDYRSPTHTFASQLTAFLTNTLPFSLETVILYMPAYLSSLLIIPMIFIGRTLGNTYLGVISALIASVVWSYYNRTMTGYYDTDMLNIVFPMFILLGFVQTIIYKQTRYILISLVFILLYQSWYVASYSLILSLIFIFIVYLVMTDKKNKSNYLYFSLLLITLSQIEIWIKIPLLLGLYFLSHFQKEKLLKYIYYIFGISLILAILTGSLNPILSNLKLYIFREAFAGDMENIKLYFYSVTQTVREAGQIPFETFANRISGHTISFVISIIGYFLLVVRYPIMLLTLPMLGLGFLASSAGLRFTVYAVPPMAFGFAFIVLFLINYLHNYIKDEKQLVFAKMSMGILLVATFLYPNIKHIESYKVPTVFKKSEVSVLENLKTIATKDDFVLTWWDYGYPIRFYTNMNTLVDGGLHSGNLNFPISFMLMSNQIASANMARLNVEYSKKNKLFKDMLVDYDSSNPNTFLKMLDKKTFENPKSTSDVYLYLPDRMLSILPTVNLFSNMNLMTGQQKKRPLFYQTQYFKDDGKVIHLGQGISFFKNTGMVKIGNKKVNLNKFIVTEYDKDKKLHVHSQKINFSGELILIYMKNYNRFLLVDKKIFNSAYIQLYVLENYDDTLYEPTILTPLVKIFKLKI